MKVWNAGKYALAQGAPDGPVTHPLDLSFLARLRETAGKATAAFDELDYAGALDTVERFFWSGYTDNYLEMVKARARSDADPAGRASAVEAVQKGLSVLLRLFAPYLPYVTEEVWSWGFARASGTPSVHRAAWPSSAELAEAAPGAAGGAAFDAACGFLDAVRRAKSAAGATVGRQLARLRVAASPRTVTLLGPCLADLASAARADGDVLSPREGMEDGAFEVTEIGRRRRRKPTRELGGADGTISVVESGRDAPARVIELTDRVPTIHEDGQTGLHE
jgi:valyl-tRNA synthetase